MRYFIQLFFILCLALNLVGPSLTVLASTENNKQLICTSNGFQWVSQQEATLFFDKVAQQIGIDPSTLANVSDTPTSKNIANGTAHCPLCIFEFDSPGIISNYAIHFPTDIFFVSITIETNDHVIATPVFLQPPNRAPPINFV